MAPEEAERFLCALGVRFTFQTFDDSRRRDWRLSRVLHGTLAERADTLTSLNAHGAGVFVMINEGNGRDRKASNVQRIRAYFADFDATPPPDAATVPLAPHAVIESSPDRWHWYWWIDGAPLDAFADVQRAIAEHFGSDPKVCDLPRVMRLPGFWHRKGEPFLTRIVELRGAPRFTHTEFVHAFSISLATHDNRAADAENANVTHLPTAQHHKRTLPAIIPEGERNITLLRLAAGLVRKGHALQAVTDRLQRINAERCRPPLCATEVNTIAARAYAYGSQGFTILPHALLDSPEWKALAPPAHDIMLTAFRRFDGSNNGNIALTWADFDGRPGFGQKHTFYRHRRSVLASGILQARAGGNSQRGKMPDLFAIAPQWIRSPVSKKAPGASVEKHTLYIDKQSWNDLEAVGKG